MTYYGYTVKFTALPGKRDELAAILLESAKQLEGNADCIHYLISIPDKPDDIWITETWKTKEAHDAALEPAEAKLLIQQARPFIADVSKQHSTIILGGKGL